MRPCVHTEAGSPRAKPVALRSELAAVAGLAVKDSFVAVLVGRIQHLVAHAALEALLVEGELAHHPRLGSVYGFAASRALDLFWGLEGHCGLGGGSFSWGTKTSGKVCGLPNYALLQGDPNRSD